MKGFPAARVGDPVTHDLIVPSGVIASLPIPPPTNGPVLIEGMQAAYVGCTVMCSGVTAGGPIIAPPFHQVPPAVQHQRELEKAAKDIEEIMGWRKAQPEYACVPPSEAKRHRKPDKKKFLVRMVDGYSGGGTGPGLKPGLGVGGKAEVLYLEFWDLEEGVKATYLFIGGGPSISVGLPVGFTVQDKGPWNAFEAERDITVRDFGGEARFTYSTVLKIGWLTQSWFGFGGYRDDVPEDVVERMKYTSHKYFIDSFESASRDLLPPSFAESSETKGEMTLLDESIEEYSGDECAPPVTPAIIPILTGSKSVFIHGQPAARWAPSGDTAMCGTFLGDLKQSATRTVFIG